MHSVLPKDNLLKNIFLYFIPYNAILKVRKKAKIRYRYDQVQHLKLDYVWESDESTKKHEVKSHLRAKRSDKHET